MSEPLPQPPAGEPPATETPVGEPRRRPRWVPVAAIAAAALLVGALAATGVFLLVGRADQHRYTVTLFLTREATDAQKAAIRSALQRLHPLDGITFEDHDTAYQHFKETFKDHPDVLKGVDPAALPESFRLTTKGTEFDCAQLAPVHALAGVDEIQVIQLPTKGHAGAAVGCGYAPVRAP